MSVAIQPRNAPSSLKLLGQLVDDVWAVAGGDRSTDYNYYSKRALLAGCVPVRQSHVGPGRAGQACLAPASQLLRGNCQGLQLCCSPRLTALGGEEGCVPSRLSCAPAAPPPRVSTLQGVHLHRAVHAHRLLTWLCGHVAGGCWGLWAAWAVFV